jgi:hypothetical protein
MNAGSGDNDDDAGSINTSGGSNGHSGGSISTQGGAGGSGGSIDASASTYAAGGSILTNAVEGGAGGSIDTRGEGANGFSGGYINTSAGEGGNGGYIDTSSTADGAGGYINTSIGGGSIDTRGTGSIGLGVTGTRTTIVGTATADRNVSYPNADGTLALTQQATDYEVTDATRGVIMKSPNGSRWRLTIDNSGSLIRTIITLVFLMSFICGSQAQVRDLVYGTNNVVVGPTNTNALSFTNSIAFSNVLSFGTNTAEIRTNLGLGASWLTNSASPATTNATNLIAGTLPDARLSTNVAILSNLPTWATTTNAATARTNLSLGTTNNVEFRTVKTLGTGSSSDVDIRLGQQGNGIWGSGGPNSVAVAVASNNVTTFYQTNTTFSVPIDFNNTTNAAVTRTNLGVSVASNLPAPYSGAAASNSLLTADGAGGSSFVANRITTIIKSSDQSKTNTSDMTVVGNNDPELTVSVVAGTIYSIQARLQYTAPSTGGLNATIVTGTNNVFVNTGGPVGFASREDLNARVFYISSATGGAVAGISWGGSGSSTGGTNLIWAATGVFRAENSGTLTLRWAQNTTNATPTTLKAGSSFTLTKLN